MKQKVVYLIVALLAGVGIFFLGVSFSGNSVLVPLQLNLPAAKQQVTKLALLIDNGEKITGYEKLDLPKSVNALELLKTVTTEHNIKLDYDTSSPLGAFVKQIGNEVNGQGNKYWQYWVNGVQPMVAADKFVLRGGETVLWTFKKSAL